jgi:alkaline phosphatase D
VIIETEPDLWIWAGDNVYGDSPDTEVLKEKYQQQYNQPDYQVFRKSVPIIGTWDDHDYGENNSGKWFQSKEAAQQLALDFLEEPDDSLRRSRKGIYTSYIFGPAEKQVKIVTGM